MFTDFLVKICLHLLCLYLLKGCSCLVKYHSCGKLQCTFGTVYLWQLQLCQLYQVTLGEIRKQNHGHRGRRPLKPRISSLQAHCPVSNKAHTDHTWKLSCLQECDTNLLTFPGRASLLWIHSGHNNTSRPLWDPPPFVLLWGTSSDMLCLISLCIFYSMYAGCTCT